MGARRNDNRPMGARRGAFSIDLPTNYEYLLVASLSSGTVPPVTFERAPSGEPFDITDS